MFNSLFKDFNYKNVTGLNHELKAIYVYNKFISDNKPILFVTSTLYKANSFYKSLKTYTNDVLFFPMDNFLTSEALASSPELFNDRLDTINNLIKDNKKIVVTNLMGLLRYLPSRSNYKNNIINIKVGEDYDVNKLKDKLIEVGYTRETIVTKTGEVAIRGFVVDIFPLDSDKPIRLEFFGDTVESIREFDVDTQLTVNKLTEVQILPMSERLDGTFESIINYLDNNLIIYNEYSEIEKEYNDLLNEIKEYNESLGINKEYMHKLEDINVINTINLEKYDNVIENNDNISYISYDIEAFPSALDEINNVLNKYLKNKKTVVICLKNQYQINKIIDNIKNNNIVITNEDEIFEGKINLIIKDLEKGFIFNNYVVISDNELFHKNTNKIKYKNNFKYSTKIRNVDKLEIGDYVVHNVHGIGRYLGIKTLTKGDLTKDYLVVEYRDSDKLYIPVEKIELISKYSANGGMTPKLNKLGGIEWTKTKKRVKEKLENIAGELLELYAKRESSVGFAFKKDDKYQIEFENEFIYDDTVDQRKVTEEIKRDMEKSRPMDRLLCGDVGYGKTEVAFRAMFKAVYSGKQVAFLCPTTILSSQHYKNALERFKDYPVTIACLNRFISVKEKNRILSDLKEGKIDILIGTHRILSDDVIFKDLGLLVIDEEQRFGVKHKEKIKKMKESIDVLTLSATPIPRTLQMSMVGIRNLSLIETPPVNRYPIQTYVLEENSKIIKDAIYKEIARDGQVFILYNHIDDLERKAAEIKMLVPEANIVCAHGQMDKNKLEQVMLDFINKEYNVLLCTTIIETGIDIPSVNTLLIMDADRFGLSQLYQIRGRVGRGNVIAYCYLMYTKGKTITDIAEKRLNAIREFTELGSGFKIAVRDLSIRGAGDILGSEQAGFIDSVGIDLYLKMLDDEIKRLKGEKVDDEVKDEQPLLDVSTTISDNYVEETELKIEIHRMINEIDSYEKLDEVKNTLEDRFGKFSEDINIYMYEELFEKLAKDIGVESIRQTKTFIETTLTKELTNNIDGQKLFLDLSRLSRMFRFKMHLDKLVVTLDTIKLDKHYVYYLIDFMEILKNAKKNDN